MKTWKLVSTSLFILLGFSAGVGLNYSHLNLTVHGAQGDPNPALKSVAHNATLAGEGTTITPLGIANSGVGTPQIANGAVTAPKLSTSATPSPGQVLGFNGNLAWQNASVGGMRVVDSFGNIVGPAQTASVALRRIGQYTFVLFVGPSGFHTSGNFIIYHTTPDCTGPRYFREDGTFFQRLSFNTSTQVFFAADPLQQITINSDEVIGPTADPNQPGPCSANVTPFTGVFGVLTSLDLTNLGLTPPFHLEF